MRWKEANDVIKSIYVWNIDLLYFHFEAYVEKAQKQKSDIQMEEMIINNLYTFSHIVMMHHEIT
jgi:hypothetical protein